MTNNLLRVVFILAASVSGQARAQQILELDVMAKGIAYSPQKQMLYATIPSAEGPTYGNRLIAISPLDATIVGSVFVGSEPGPVAVSSDGALAYVGLDGAAQVRPVDLATLTAGAEFSLGRSSTFGPLYAQEIAVMPGSPNTIAVSRRDDGFSTSYQGVAIYDTGVMRPTYDTGFEGGTTIAFGSQPTTLYGYDNEVSDFNLFDYAIDASGVSVVSSASNVISGFGVTIVFDGGTIFATSGAAVDSATFNLMGTYESSGPVVVDDALGWVIFVRGNVVEPFDRTTYLSVPAIPIPAASGNPVGAVGCGAACLAVVFDSNQIFVVRDIRDEIFANGFE